MGLLSFNSMPLIAGSLNSYTKKLEMSQKFEKRKENANFKTDEEEMTKRERDLIRFKEDAARIREGDQISSLDLKLKSGGELTKAELDYLREKSPELYKEAVEIKRERQRYKKELESCNTKEEVEGLHSRKMQEFTAEVKSVKGNPNIPQGKKAQLIDQICRRFMGIMSEHAEFVKSDSYGKLPEDEEESKEKKVKKSSTVSDEPLIGNLEESLKFEFIQMNILKPVIESGGGGMVVQDLDRTESKENTLNIMV